MANLTFRSSRIQYYGPHPCSNCNRTIVKMSAEFGGSSFNNPTGPIYPNTEWHPHVCDPADVRKKAGQDASIAVRKDWPGAHVYKCGNGKGFLVLGHAEPSDQTSDAYWHPLVISHNCNYYDTPWAAWSGALERQVKGNPTWTFDRAKDERSYISDDLQRLPECPTDGAPSVERGLEKGSQVRFNPSTGNDTSLIYTILDGQLRHGQWFYQLRETPGVFVRNSLVPVLQ